MTLHLYLGTLLHRLAVCYLLSWCRIQFHRIESSIFYQPALMITCTRARTHMSHVTAPPHAKDKRASSKHVRTHTSPHTISHKQSTCARHSFCKVKIKNQKAERIHSLSYRSIEFQTNCNIPFRCHGCNAPPLTIRLTVTRNSSCSV